jgi:hypothetical protein
MRMNAMRASLAPFAGGWAEAGRRAIHVASNAPLPMLVVARSRLVRSIACTALGPITHHDAHARPALSRALRYQPLIGYSIIQNTCVKRV